MKYILPLFAFFVLAFAPPVSADNHEKVMEAPISAPATTIVAFHADWCGGCKILAPKMEKVMEMLDEETKSQFSMLKFDFTDNETTANSRALAEEKGLSSLISSPTGKPATGMLKIIDTASGEILTKIHYNMSEEEITNAIKTATQRS